VFVFFAFSFLGYYELTLPSKWSNKVDSASNVGGIIGIACSHAYDFVPLL
jgi:thiol:disulfide interchange protein DsbD